MSFRCPNATPVSDFYLLDHQLHFSGVATVIPAIGSYVPGALWSITPECEESLDAFEGFPTLYRKKTITQRGREFMLYMLNDCSIGAPSRSYIECIAEGYQDFNLPLHYLHARVTETSIEDIKMQHRTQQLLF